jgi:His/Glu/Gln/Arg/opine family amino acid ABC transporter permease subunit
MMRLDFSIILNNWQLLGQGLWLTVVICSLSLVLAMLGGAVLALSRLSRAKWLNFLSTSYIELFRNVPFLIQIFLWYYVLPFLGVRLPAFVVGIIALSALASAYYAEIIRGAIQSVPGGQLESARAAGMSSFQSMRHIIFPQMMGYLIPPATNQSTSLIKESSLLSTITVMELTMAAQRVQALAFSHVEVLITVALIYWAINALLSFSAGRLEERLQKYKRGRAQSGLAAGPLLGRATA